MGLLESDYERGKRDGEAEAERREKEGTGLVDLLIEIADGVANIANPEYGKGYKNGFEKGSK